MLEYSLSSWPPQAQKNTGNFFVFCADVQVGSTQMSRYKQSSENSVIPVLVHGGVFGVCRHMGPFLLVLVTNAR